MDRPLSVALIGIGTRARKLYLPLASAVAPWLRYVAIVSPNPESARKAGERLGVPAFGSVPELLRAGVAEAALVLSSIDSHHAISLLLSEAGVHHLVETTMASTLTQARQMADAAERAGVVLGVAENYFRFPFDRLARKVALGGAIGEVYRLTCYHDQVGWHGHARWMKFYGAAPEAVQSFVHTMPTARHNESANRVHTSESFRINHLHFPGDRVAIDMGGNLKGLLGRTSRPGLTEIDGTRGAIIRHADGAIAGKAEVRICSDAALAENGKADFVAPFVDDVADGIWTGSSVRLPTGAVTHQNPYRPHRLDDPKLREWDGPVVLELMAQFAEQVRGGAKAEFDAIEGVKTTEIEMACRESALSGSRMLRLPVDPTGLQSESLALAGLRARYGVDPLDPAAMASVHFPPAF